MGLEYTETVFQRNRVYTDPVIPISDRAGHHTGMAFSQNLARLRNDRGWTQDELAEKVGVQQVTVSRWETAGREPRGLLRRKLADVLDVREADLFRDADSGDTIDGAIPVTYIPMLGEVPGGPWREAVQKTRNFIPAPAADTPASAYALTVVGGSMDKVARDGATIIVDPEDKDLFDKRLYVVRNAEGEVTFKQYRDNPARLVPLSSDPGHLVIPITNREYEIVARVLLIVLKPDQAAFD